MNTKVYIEESRTNRSVKVWMHNEVGSTEENLTYNSEKNEVVATVIPNNCIIGNEFKPFIEVHIDVFNAIMKACVEYNERKGVYTEREDITKGKLQQCKEHLKDAQETRDKVITLLEKIVTK